MLQHTFCHIPGIGPTTEKKLWAVGVSDWGKFIIPSPIKLSGATLASAPTILDESLTALKTHDPHYFTKELASNEKWRLFSTFRDQTAYLDIETDGLAEDAQITTIALYDGIEIYHYINGHNLDNFIRDLNKYKVIITYSGTSFDIPVIENFFKTKLPQAHIDLRYVLSSLGFTGGLKSCEKQLGLDRGKLDGVDGYFAVVLWRAYKYQGDQAALKTLVAYNIEDTVNLELLMVKAYNLKVAVTPFKEELSLPEPVQPQLPFVPDMECIRRLQGQLI